MCAIHCQSGIEELCNVKIESNHWNYIPPRDSVKRFLVYFIVSVWNFIKECMHQIPARSVNLQLLSAPFLDVLHNDRVAF